MCQRLRAPDLKWISDRRRSVLCSPPTAVNESTSPEKISATLRVGFRMSGLITRTRGWSHASGRLDHMDASLAVEALDPKRTKASGHLPAPAIPGATLG